MPFTIAGGIFGFIAWVCVKRFLREKTGRRAIVVFSFCVTGGLFTGLYFDADLIRAVILAILSDPVRY